MSQAPSTGDRCAHAGRVVGALGVVALALAPLAVPLLQGRTLAWFDTVRVYAPQRWLVEEALRDLRLPLWNPFLGGGMPLAADGIHGVLHPVSILVAWLRLDRSVDLLIVGHVAVAGVGAAILARALGASRAGSAIAAVAYASSGYVLSMAGNLVFLAGAGSLPLCAAGVRGHAATPGPGRLALAAGGVALAAFSGDFQALPIGVAIGLALAAEAGGLRGLVRAATSIALGLLLAAVQLLPSAVHFLRSERAEGRWSAAIWSLAAGRLPELALPGIAQGADPFSDPVFAGLAGAGGWPPENLPFPFAASVFIGALPLALAVIGARSARVGRVLAVSALLLGWLALGHALGADAALGWVPVWSAFRYPEKLVGPLSLVVAVLAALGADALSEGRASGRRLVATFAATALLALAGAAAALVALDAATADLARPRVLRGGWHLAAAAAGGAAWLAARRRLGPRGGRVALAGLVAASSWAAAPMALRPGDPEARLSSPGPALFAPPPGPRLLTLYLHEPSPIHGLDQHDRLAGFGAALAYPAFNVRFGIDSLGDYAAMVPGRLARLRRESGRLWPLVARRMGATHLVADPPLVEEEEALHAAATRGALWAGRTPAPADTWILPGRPWASFASEVQSAPAEPEATVALLRAVVSGQEVVTVEGSGAFETSPGRVLSISRGAEVVRVEAETPAEGTLVVLDAWSPGWSARIDGLPVEIHAADVLARAIRWPAGRHVLEMTYDPPEARAGVWLSALGLLLLAFLALRSRTIRQG